MEERGSGSSPDEESASGGGGERGIRYEADEESDIEEERASDYEAHARDDEEKAIYEGCSHAEEGAIADDRARDEERGSDGVRDRREETYAVKRCDRGSRCETGATEHEIRCVPDVCQHQWRRTRRDRQREEEDQMDQFACPRLGQKAHHHTSKALACRFAWAPRPAGGGVPPFRHQPRDQRTYAP